MREKDINDEEKMEIELRKNYKKAEDLLKDKDKLDRFLEKTEKKLKGIPKLGNKLSHIPVFVQLVKAYIRGEYRELPTGSLIAIISALIYFVTPIDLILDFIPGIGLLDDAGVVMACLNFVDSDIEDFLEWRDLNS